MDKSKLAINGGPKAIDGFEAKGEAKIGNEEFMEMADTWGYSPEALEKISEIIDEDRLSGSPFLVGYKPNSKVNQLQDEAAEILRAKYVIAVTSGTAALHTAYIAIDINQGDEIIMPASTFMATAMAAVVARGIPVWCEIDESMTIDPEDIEKRITPRTKAIAPVHMSGYVCNMDAVMEIAKKHNLMVIEDCAQACGASLHGRRVGTIADIGCFSISSYKPTGGGEGGLVVTNDEKLYYRALQWSEGGGLWRPDRYALPRWEGELFCGLNYRMDELSGTVNLVQFRKMEDMLKRKRTRKRWVTANVPAYKELKPQVIHDLDGEHGDKVGFFARTAEEAENLAKALSAEGLSAGTRGRSDSRDWHIYKYVSAVMDKLPATSDGCPWIDPKTGKEVPVEYSPDMCPKTLDLLSRHVAVGLDQWWTENDCKKVAKAMTKVFDAMYNRDEKYSNLLEAIAID
ncbi:aminotransferase class V-fold PLP-dependent enzyme [Candidatus Poribacteria bacterium]|nr:aminotransferase class V-fold PLP-dependent enzyme [Candidatus Poribacteria bacterium]